MAGNTFIAVPPGIESDPIALRRFLLQLIEWLDVAFGNRGEDPFATSSAVSTVDSRFAQFLTKDEAADAYITITDSGDFFVRKDGSTPFTNIQSYTIDETFTDGKELIAKKYADDNFTYNPSGTDPGDLSQVISSPPTQAEVQAISNKVDAILAELRIANII